MYKKLEFCRVAIVEQSWGFNASEQKALKFDFKPKLRLRLEDISPLIADLHNFRAHLALRMDMTHEHMEQIGLSWQYDEMEKIIGMLRLRLNGSPVTSTSSFTPSVTSTEGTSTSSFTPSVTSTEGTSTSSFTPSVTSTEGTSASPLTPTESALAPPASSFTDAYIA